MKQDFDNGKYTVVFEEDTGKLYALRYGKPWRDMTGDNLVLAMLQSVDSMSNKFKNLIELSQKHAWENRNVNTPSPS